jgi:hypothetical protein
MAEVLMTPTEEITSIYIPQWHMKAIIAEGTLE